MRRCASTCTRGETAAGQGQKLTHPGPTRVLQRARKVRAEKGTMKGRDGPDAQERPKSFTGERERGGVHRGFRHPKSKQRDANLQREKRRLVERQREKERRKGILRFSCLGPDDV